MSSFNALIWRVLELYDSRREIGPYMIASKAGQPKLYLPPSKSSDGGVCTGEVFLFGRTTHLTSTSSQTATTTFVDSPDH
ncbi:hypothetical protein M408DRAFT_27575 [Serendipita vermifera MAFF 305830]|uniref:Uncharacterized protein n=1 Tax=Serendipita vermifera MAFF 305830 TaxID=933852 RepID=A0A0C3AV12_SERVB|nr:hypothetical protein M408DRAFT_27575 [Serendipita vermifera MAFF 305830]